MSETATTGTPMHGACQPGQDLFDVTCYVVYWSPSDYPGEWVVRRWRFRDLLQCETKLWSRSLDYAGVLASIPIGLARTPRHETDEPQIWETWV